MKILNKIVIIALYSFMCCNISSLSSASDAPEDLFSEIKGCINSNHPESSSNTSINQDNSIDQDINIDNIDWGYNYFIQKVQDNNNNLKLASNESDNKQINKINNSNIKSNELIKFCPAFKNAINEIETTAGTSGLNLSLINNINKVYVFNKLQTVIIYHGLLLNMSSYYLSKQKFDKNSISSEFKKIANEFIKKSRNLYNKINKLNNKNFIEKHKEQLNELSKLINNEYDFLT